MGRGGNINFDDFKKLQKNLETLNRTQRDKFIDSCAKELAARLLAKIVKRTPTGRYPKGSGKAGGTLKRGWTGGENQNAANYAKSLPVHHFGGYYVVEIVNPVEYASYVEFGHRTRGHGRWIEGKFMLTISENEIRQAAPGILKKKLKEELRGIFQ